MKERYPNLRFVCDFFTAIGYLIMIITVVLAGLVIFVPTQMPVPYITPFSLISIISAVLIALIGISFALWVLAQVDFYRCIMDIEKNTRSNN